MFWIVRPKRCYGQTRRKVKFAFLPTRLTSGHQVWLERYLENQVYKQGATYIHTGDTGAILVDGWVIENSRPWRYR